MTLILKRQEIVMLRRRLQATCTKKVHERETFKLDDNLLSFNSGFFEGLEQHIQ